MFSSYRHNFLVITSVSIYFGVAPSHFFNTLVNRVNRFQTECSEDGDSQRESVVVSPLKNEEKQLFLPK